MASPFGNTAKPTYGQESWYGASENQHDLLVTMPETGTLTRLGGWVAGRISSCSFRFVVWSGAGTVLGYTNLITAAGLPVALGNSYQYEGDLITPVPLSGGYNFFIGVSRNPTGALQFGFNSSGTHYDSYTASWPGSVSGHSAHAGSIGMYAYYIVGADDYVRRGGAWVKGDKGMYVRRSGLWTPSNAEVSVRRSGGWTKA